jgi:hypothetical protein
MEKSAFTLDDPRPTQAAAPYTFFLPDPRRIDAVCAGDHVKLIFVPAIGGTKYSAERMWVEIVSISGSRFRGKLDNIPDDIPGLSLGDPVEFSSWHIIDVKFADIAKDAQFTFPRREYYERCLVDQCVLSGEVKVHFVYREAPDLTEDGEKYQDSGWRVRGDWRGLSDNEVEARECKYTALGRVLNQDDSWIHLIDQPVGSAFLRDWEKNEFVPEGE